MGYLLPKYGVDGIFEGETAKAVGEFQHDESIPQTKKLDKLTLKHLNERFDTRKPYIDNATLDPANPEKGTRKLSAADRKATYDAMAPKRGTKGSSSTFQEDVGGKKYGPSMEAHLKTLIADFIRNCLPTRNH